MIGSNRGLKRVYDSASGAYTPTPESKFSKPIQFIKNKMEN